MATSRPDELLPGSEDASIDARQFGDQTIINLETIQPVPVAPVAPVEPAEPNGRSRCANKECSNEAAYDGWCVIHVKPCVASGCEKYPANGASGFCKMHAQIHATLHRGRKMCMYEGDGTVEDQPCIKVAASKGYCRKHGGGSRCKEEACGKFSVRRGFCKQHANARGFLLPEKNNLNVKSGPQMCRFVDPNGTPCSKFVASKGLCSTHGGKKRCKEVTEGISCQKHVFTGGYCLSHARAHGLHFQSNTKRRCIHLEVGANGEEQRCIRFSESYGFCFVHGTKSKCAFELENGERCGRRTGQSYCALHLKMVQNLLSADVMEDKVYGSGNGNRTRSDGPGGVLEEASGGNRGSEVALEIRAEEGVLEH